MKTIKGAVIALSGAIKNADNHDIYDYVLCNAIHKDGQRLEYNDHKVVDWDWPVLKAFYIIDPRYKPADTSYLNQCGYKGVADIDQLKIECMCVSGGNVKAQSLTHSEEGLTHKLVDEVSDGFASREEMAKHSVIADFDDLEHPQSSWYERGDRPTVGVECEVYNHVFGKNAEWEACKILWRGEFLTVYASDSHHECSANNEHLEFRPIKAKTEREKVIEAAVKLFSGGNIYDMYNTLYDAGMLVLPPKKSDTED